MENEKAKTGALNDELLDKVSGGWDGDGDRTVCTCNPDGTEHVWGPGYNGKKTCIYCGVYQG